MSRHISEWLNAYLDGELFGSRLQQVEAHLAECPTCQAELASMERLSGLLQESPLPAMISPERLATQVNLRLPQRSTETTRAGSLEIGWWMIPVGLLGAWVFVTTSFYVSDMLSAANSLGLLTSISDWLLLGSSSEGYWSTLLGQFGILRGNGLVWAATAEALAGTSMTQIILQVSIALLYLSWMAIWWARQASQQKSRLIAG